MDDEALGLSPREVAERKKILQSIFEDPHLQAVAKRVRQKTCAVPMQSRRNLRRLRPPKATSQKRESRGSDDSTKSRKKLPPIAKKIIIDCQQPEQFDSLIDQVEPAGRVPQRSHQIVVDARSVDSLERAVADIEQGKSIADIGVKGRVLSYEKSDRPDAFLPESPGKTPAVEKKQGGRAAKSQRKILLRDLETFDQVIQSIESGQSSDNPDILVDLEDSMQYIEAIQDLEIAGRAPLDARKAIVYADTPEAFAEAIEELEQKYIELLAETKHDEDVSWMIEQLAQKMSHIPAEVFDQLLEKVNLRPGFLASLGCGYSGSGTALKIPREISGYADQIGVNPEDLYNAMRDEKLATMAQVRQAFEEMSDGTCLTMENFDIFVKTWVQSYLDKKNEEALLGLIGVSAASGSQVLSSSYARLLAEIFRQEVGGFFLAHTQNPNYNCFNLGNVIQETLLQLDEMARVCYLENLLTLLHNRDQLLIASHEVIAQTVSKAYYISLFSNNKQLLEMLAKYFSDLSLFKLGLLHPDDLPEDIVVLVPESIYEFLDFVSGFPPNLSQRNSKVIYMLKKLSNNDPMLLRYR